MCETRIFREPKLPEQSACLQFLEGTGGQGEVLVSAWNVKEWKITVTGFTLPRVGFLQCPPCACSVSQSCARKVLKLPISLKRKYCEVHCKGDEVDVLGVQEVTCSCQPP